MIRCNHCNEELDHLDYRVDLIETGAADICVEDGEVTIDSHEEGSYDEYGLYRYKCPECEEDVSIALLLIEEDTDDRTETPQRSRGPGITAESRGPIHSAGEITFINKREINDLLAAGAYCPKCETHTPTDFNEEESAECEKCSYIITRNSLINV